MLLFLHDTCDLFIVFLVAIEEHVERSSRKSARSYLQTTQLCVINVGIDLPYSLPFIASSNIVRKFIQAGFLSQTIG